MSMKLGVLFLRKMRRMNVDRNAASSPQNSSFTLEFGSQAAVSNTVATNTSDNTHVYLAVNPHWIFVSVT